MAIIWLHRVQIRLPTSIILPHLVQLHSLGGETVRHWRDQ